MNSRSSIDTAIGHFTVPDHGSINTKGVNVYGSAEITSHQNSFLQIGEKKVGVGQVRLKQVGSSQDSVAQVNVKPLAPIHFDIAQISSTPVNSFTGRVNQTGSKQISLPQNDIFHSDTRHVSSTQVDSTQITIFDNATLRTSSSSEANPSKVSFTSSIELEQFISRHELWPLGSHSLNKSTATIHNTTLNHWNLFYDSLSVEFKVSDLPLGQLAEAKITAFGSDGYPIFGTLTLVCRVGTLTLLYCCLS